MLPLIEPPEIQTITSLYSDGIVNLRFIPSDNTSCVKMFYMWEVNEIVEDIATVFESIENSEMEYDILMVKDDDNVYALRVTIKSFMKNSLREFLSTSFCRMITSAFPNNKRLLDSILV